MVGNQVAQELGEMTVWLANLRDTSVHSVAAGLAKTHMVVDIMQHHSNLHHVKAVVSWPGKSSN